MPDRGSQSGPRPAHIQVVENRVAKAPQPPTVLNTCNKNPGTESGSSKEISAHSSPADNHHETPTLEEVTAKQSTLLCDLQSADDPGAWLAMQTLKNLVYEKSFILGTKQPISVLCSIISSATFSLYGILHTTFLVCSVCMETMHAHNHDIDV